MKTILFLLLFVSGLCSAQQKIYKSDLGVSILLDSLDSFTSSSAVGALSGWLLKQSSPQYEYDTTLAHVVVSIAAGVPFSSCHMDVVIGDKRYQPYPVMVMLGHLVRTKKKNDNGDYIVIKEELYDMYLEPMVRRFNVHHYVPIFLNK